MRFLNKAERQSNQAPNASGTSGPSGVGRVRARAMPQNCVPPPVVPLRALVTNVSRGGTSISSVETWLPLCWIAFVRIAMIGTRTSRPAAGPRWPRSRRLTLLLGGRSVNWKARGCSRAPWRVGGVPHPSWLACTRAGRLDAQLWLGVRDHLVALPSPRGQGRSSRSDDPAEDLGEEYSVDLGS